MQISTIKPLTVFSFKGKDFIATAEFCEARTMRFCVNLDTGLLHRFPLDVSVEPAVLYTLAVK